MVAGFAALTGAPLASGQVARLGMMGDSLTDEYAEDTFNYATNWSMQLAQYRSVWMGLTAAAAGAPGGTWGEPRRTWFESNWARYGDDSTTCQTDGQVSGLASQVGPGWSNGVTHVFIEIGTNDFSPNSSAFLNIYFGFWSQAQITSYVNTCLANIETIVSTLDNTGAAILLGNYVDFSVVPATRSFYGNATSRNKVAAVVTRVNTGIETIAHNHRVVLVDLNKMGSNILGTNTALKQFLTIGNVQIQLFNRDTTTHTNPLAGFVDDGAHPHTTLQGVFANLVMSALNQGWGAHYTLFTDSEILDHAGIAYGGADTLDSQVGPYSQYIRSYRCPGDTNRDGVVNSIDLGQLLAHFGEATGPGLVSAGADFNHDGVIDTLDLGSLLAAFGSACP